MLVRLLFNDKDNRCNGYLLYYKEIYPYDEQDEIIMIETDTVKLGEFLGKNWKEKFEKLILIDGEVRVDGTLIPIDK